MSIDRGDQMPDDESKRCRSCAAPIRADASRCPHCREPQGRTSFHRRPLAWIAAATTLLSLIFSGNQLVQAVAQSGANTRAVRGYIETARTLADAGDFEAAWSSIESARSLDPLGADVGAVESDVAVRWLLEGTGLPTNWVPRNRGNAAPPEQSPGQIAERLLIPLVTAATASEGETRADLEAVFAWCRFLRGREALAHRRDIEPLLLAARESAPGAHLPNLLLGYWRAGIQGDPAGAEEPWRDAIRIEASREVRVYTRPLQIHVLGHHVRRAGNREEERASNASARRQLLIALDEMRREDRSIRGMLVPGEFMALYFDRRDQFVIESTWAVLSDEAHLAILDWAEHEFETEKASYKYDYQRFRFLKSQALSKLGRTEEARRELALAREDVRAGKFRDVLDTAWLEATGERPLPAGEWALRRYHLDNSDFDSSEVQEAIDALTGQRFKWSPPNSRAFGPATDSAIRVVEEVLAGSQPGATSRSALEEWLRQLQLVAGVDRVWHGEYEHGLRTLEGLAGNPATSPTLRAAVFFELARAYLYSPVAISAELIRSDAEFDVRYMYANEGLDRLGAALVAGFEEWDRVEDQLVALRDHPGYSTLSVRHDRIPPPQ